MDEPRDPRREAELAFTVANVWCDRTGRLTRNVVSATMANSDLIFFGYVSRNDDDASD